MFPASSIRKLLATSAAMGALAVAAGKDVAVYTTADMEEAKTSKEDVSVVLHSDISVQHNEVDWWVNNSLYNLSNYSFTNGEGEARHSLSFIGNTTGNEDCGEVIRNGAATFSGLGAITFAGWVNTHTDYTYTDTGTKLDIAAYAYGGALTGNDGGSDICFRDNSAVSFSNITYDSSDWGAASCNVAVYGGAIYTEDSATVTFEGNGALLFEKIGITNKQSSNFSYKNFVAHGGAVKAPHISFLRNTAPLNITDCFILQENVTGDTGVGKGGALYVGNSLTMEGNKSSIALDANSVHTANTAYGGAIHLAENATGSISHNELHVQLTGNHVSTAPDEEFKRLEDSLAADCVARGGAIYLADGAQLELHQNAGNISLSGNYATSDYSKVPANGNSSDHDDDPALAQGGAVYLAKGATLSINTNGAVGDTATGHITLSGNKVSATGTGNTTAEGGAIYLEKDATLSMDNNRGDVTYTDNSAERGGAIFACGGSLVTLSGNEGTVNFTANKATPTDEWDSDVAGGAIYTAGILQLNSNKGGVSFTANSAKQGSALYAADGAQVQINSNAGNVTFSQNNSSTGAIYVATGAEVQMSYNTGTLLFDNAGADAAALYGETQSAVRMEGNAAICIRNHETITHSAFHTQGDLSLCGNSGPILITANSALSTEGGGVFHLAGSSATLSLCDNSGRIEASGNYAMTSGGVIHGDAGSHIRICGNADVNVTGNDSRRGGAAIDTAGTLDICHNQGAVSFGNNRVYDDTTNTTTLRSICTTAPARFSADKGASVEFRDSILIAPADTSAPALHLNADYTDANNTTHSQQGDIIFTGQYIPGYLSTLSTNTDAQASARSSVQGSTLLHNGRLIISHQAVLEGTSLTTAANSHATLLLAHQGVLAQQNVTISTGTSLQAGLAGAPTALSSPLLTTTLQQLVETTTACGLMEGGALTLQSGSSYAMYGGVLDLGGGALTLNAASAAIVFSGTNTPITLAGQENILLLFTGVDSMSVEDGSLFTYQNHTYRAQDIIHNQELGAVYLRNVIIPEPATSTLCLLALAALTSRRRRQPTMR